MSFQRPPDLFLGLPLNAATFVVFDTETTGLDVATDRVIEIGAVRINDNAHDAHDAYDRLINPGIPIPPASTGIHGITDQDVADAAPFRDVITPFVEWVGPTVVLGYATGFDLAILKNEHLRHDLVWKAPIGLDVRHLVRLIAPALPSDSLEAVAHWLDIEPDTRHRALGDARMTAAIFLAILPALREKGITTIAQAQRACRKRPGVSGAEAAEGWHDTLREAHSVPGSIRAYARIDSYPYRHRIDQVMSTPPITTDGALPLKSALRQMMETKISSLFVTAPSESEDNGIITERDILRAVDQHGPAALDIMIDKIARRPLVSVPGSEFVYRAISRMAEQGFRHLGVIDDNGVLIGALSAGDLLKQRAGEAVSLGDNIDAAKTASALGAIWSDLVTVAGALSGEDVDARDIAAVISRELRALTRRACQIAEQEMANSEDGPPPCAYAMMVLGSGGRGESLLAMDQDNAIVYAEGDPDSETDRWFARLGQRTAHILDQAGVSYCKGGIMASNPQWRKSLSHWQETVDTWLSRARPEDILNSDIFFDSAPVIGDTGLARILCDHTLTSAGQTATFLKALSLRAAEFQVPLGMFGRFRLTNGRMDLKIGGIMPVFSTARVLALQNGISARSTPDRLEAFASLNPGKKEIIDTLLETHRILLGAILHQQLLDVQAGIPLSNAVDPTHLSKHERNNLKWALEQVSLVSGLLDTPLFLG